MKLKLVPIDTNNEGRNDGGWFNADVREPGPESKDGRPVIVPGTMKPLNPENLSLEEQAIVQVLTDQVEKAKNSGVNDIEITPDLVTAKMKQLKEEKRNRRRPKH